jgi:hypothetical protein
VVVAGSGPLLLPVAPALSTAGARVARVAEQAPAARVARFALGLWRSPTRALQAARYRFAFRSAAYRPGAWVVRASGDGAVSEATLTDGRRTWTEACDYLCVGYGLVPATELARLMDCAVEDGRGRVDAWQRTSREDLYCAGETTGIGGVEAARVEGEIAGLAAAGRRRDAEPLLARRARARAFAARLEDAFALRAELRDLADGETVVCRCEDVRLGRLRPEWSARQARLYTRTGMGPCQGRICGPALQHLFGWEPAGVRPPVVVAPGGALLAPADRLPTGNEST